MTLSGTIDYAATGSVIIQMALEQLSRKGFDKSVSSTQTTQALVYLNSFIKLVEAVYGPFQWKEKIGYLFLEKDVIEYTLGTSQTAHWTKSYVTSVLTSAAASGATTLALDTTGMTTGDNIVMYDTSGLIMTDGGSRITVTVDSSTQVTLSAGTTSAISSGARVYTYTTVARAPIRVFDTVARRQYQSSAADATPIESPREVVLTRDIYTRYPNKYLSTVPMNMGYMRSNNTDKGVVTTYGTPNDGTSLWLIPFQEPIDDIDNATSGGTDNDLDFPVHWNIPLSFALAYYLGRPYEKDVTWLADLRNDAANLIAQVLSADTMAGNLVVTPNVSWLMGRV